VSRYLLIARRWAVVAGLGAAVADAAACKRQRADTTNPFVTSLIFDDASPDAREALSTTVNFRVTDENFARWQQAQDNLDRLPRSAIGSGTGSGGSAIDRAVMRLQSSPRARRAIESAGLSVQDFVLETIALAQSTQATQPGMSAGRSEIIAANSRFVSQYQARLRSRSQAYARSPTPDSIDTQPGVVDNGAAGLTARLGVSSVDQVQQSRRQQELEAQRQIDSAQEHDAAGRSRARADSARDSVPAVRRDTIPDGGR